MPPIVPADTTFSFEPVFNAALVEYRKQTGKDITTHPLSAKLEYCNSPDAVLAVFQEQVQAFNQFRRGDWKVQLMRKLTPVVNAVLALSASEVLGEGLGVVRSFLSMRSLMDILQGFPPAKAIFAGIGILLIVCLFLFSSVSL